MSGEAQDVSRAVVADDRPLLVGYDLIDVMSIAVAAAIAVSVATNERGAFRAVVGVAFALFVPGRSIVSNWPKMEERSHIAASVLFSVASLTLIATVTLWMGFWHPLGLLEVECAVSTVALFVAIVRRRRSVHARGAQILQSEPSE